MFIRTRTRTLLGRGNKQFRRTFGDHVVPYRPGEVVTYYQAVESYRDKDGKPRHRILASWRDQPTITDAIAACEAEIRSHRTNAKRDRRWIATGKAGRYCGSDSAIMLRYPNRASLEASAADHDRRAEAEAVRLLALRAVEAKLSARLRPSPPSPRNHPCLVNRAGDGRNQPTGLTLRGLARAAFLPATHRRSPDNVRRQITRTRPDMSTLRLSYAELGERLGRSADAARVLARRRGWQRITGNDGRVVVLVDEAELPRTVRPNVRVTSPEQAEQRPDTDRLRDELEAELASPRSCGSVSAGSRARPPAMPQSSPSCTTPWPTSPAGWTGPPPSWPGPAPVARAAARGAAAVKALTYARRS